MSHIAAVAAVVMLLSAGCANVTAPVPTLACGGVHLVVANRGSAAVAVRINGTQFATVDAGGSVELIQWLTPDLGQMTWPWRVAIVDPGTGSVLATREVREETDSGSAVLQMADGALGTPTVSEVQAGPGC